MYPQVLLFGNGLYRCYGENSWNSFLRELCPRDDLPDDLENELKSPMILKSQLIADGDVKTALEKTDHKFYGVLENAELRQMRAVKKPPKSSRTVRKRPLFRCASPRRKSCR